MKSPGVKIAVLMLAIAVTAILLSGRTLSAFVKTDVEKVKTSGSCEGCDLRNANLSGEYLADASLIGADLGGANLRGANLSRANLTGARLVDAYLTNARLVGANLTDTSLSGAHMDYANLSEALWADREVCSQGSFGTCWKWSLNDLLFTPTSVSYPHPSP